MDVADLHSYCLELPHVTEDQPFGPDAVVFRIGGKIFLILVLEIPISFNVKCNPQRALELREQHEEVTPGYHMNKKHWNTVQLEGKLTNRELTDMIDHSYQLVRESLSAKIRATLPEPFTRP